MAEQVGGEVAELKFWVLNGKFGIDFWDDFNRNKKCLAKIFMRGHLGHFVRG